MKRRFSPIVIALCTMILGASLGHGQGVKGINGLGEKDANAFGFSEVPELEGLGSVALITVIGAVGYGARKIYQKIVQRVQE